MPEDTREGHKRPIRKQGSGASLVAQGKRIHHLPVQETRGRSLGGEDPTCHATTKSVHPDY